MNDREGGKMIKGCPHCEVSSFALEQPLYETKGFRVVCDVHPLIEGHLLIIPKYHLSCVGAYPDELFDEFVNLYEKFSKFLRNEYGMVAAFEHGVIGQTVFHSHVHLLPCKSSASRIVPEGRKWLRQISDLSELQNIFKKEDKYLFFSIGKRLYVVDVRLGKPRFFRDRFARALGRSERGDWKAMHENKELMTDVHEEIRDLKARWQHAFS